MVKRFFVVVLLCVFASAAYGQNELKTRAIPVGMALTGVIIAGSWTKFIINGGLGGEGYFICMDKGCLRWPEMTADYAAAGALVVGAYGLWTEQEWGEAAATAALGALLYLSFRNMGSALVDDTGEKNVLAEMMPLTISLVGSAMCLGVFIAH
ncbi:MAG TPA: hypothetical protein ENN55_04240 [Firmicutes bacterium]|nr:hypothetical protein [Bacillota bacterium]